MRPEETGLWPLNHDWKARLPNVLSLPEHLMAQGYSTISVGKIWDPRSGDGTQLGWTEKKEEWGIDDAALAIDTLDQHLAKDKPIAFFFGTQAPHCPWEPSDAGLAPYESMNIQAEGPGRTLPWEYQQTCYGAGTETLSEAQASDITRRYYGAVTDIDKVIGDFINALKARNLYDSSIIVLWSGDHGFHLGQNDHWGKWTNYTASTRIPLMIRAPGMTPGLRSPRIVESVDMYATLLDLANLSQPSHTLQGRSFAELLRNPSANHKSYAFSLWGFDVDKDVNNLDYSVKTERYNFIKWRSSGYNGLLRRGVNENAPYTLFDIINDPNETHDISKENPDVVATFTAVLEKGWRANSSL